VEINDFEVFSLGGTDAIADGPPEPGHVPDPVLEPEAAFHAVHQTPVARQLLPAHPRERIIVLSGEASLETNYGRVTLKRMGWAEVPPVGAIIRNAMPPGPEGWRAYTELMRISGHWTEAIRMAVMQFGPGRPCEYHYHDGDEYWLVYRGHFTLLCDGDEHPMSPGSVLAAGAGEEHGVISPAETFEAVGFATQLEGRKRDGHLWRPVHGDPVHIRNGG